jgi:hypothetical protein
VKRAIALAIAACSGRAPVDEAGSCAGELTGVWVADGERWMLLDDGATLEAYPLFPDVPARAATGATEIAPRFLSLTRPPATPGAAPLAGELHRRYLSHAQVCEARAPVHVTRCAGDTLELVVADVYPPLAFEPCTWPLAGPSRRVRWRR